MVATSSALTHYNFLGQNAAVPTHDTDLAVMFIAPMRPGVKLLCRTSYEMMASVMGTPFGTILCPRASTRKQYVMFLCQRLQPSYCFGNADGVKA